MGKTELKLTLQGIIKNKMKIGIDISQIVFPGTGTAVYTQNLIENLLRVDKENEYILFFSSLRGKIPPFAEASEGKQNDNSKLKMNKFPPLLLEFAWNKFHILPIEIFTGKLDVFHTSDWLEPPAKCPKVTTIHDLAIFKYPETFIARGGHDIVSNLRRKFEWVKKESKLIIAVSENTKKDIVEILGIPEKKIKVVYEACNTEFTERAKEGAEEVKRKYGIRGDYILAVGTIEPRKNLRRVIEAHNILISQYPNVSLVVAGKFGWGSEMSNDKCQMTNVKLLGYVPNEELAPLYAGAECFVYPSLYEGFGLPILEAMACGCPVVTSNLSSMPEIAGKSAILVNPESIEDITQGIEKVIGDKKTRDMLIKRGLARAKEFSWEKTARETLEIYKEVSS